MAEPGGDVLAAQLAAELRHWRRAAHELTDLDMVAAPQAWAGLESYLGTSVRAGLIRSARAVATRADQLAAQLPGTTAQDDLARLRDRVLSLRQSYVRAETVLDFFGDAVATRTNPRLAELLRGLDLLAVDAMDRILGPLGIPVPPVLVYLDKGLGASILRAGIRLWDASLSPAAAIKITRHNLLRPTAVLHEVGHQVAHLTNWTDELATALNEVLAPTSPVAAEAWHGWASEVAADVVAFVLTGYAPVPALADVVDGTTTAVYRMPPGDPHPMGLLRVAFNAALCRYWYQAGPWDDLVRTWLHRHPLSAAPPESALIMRATLPLLSEIVRVCTEQPMRAFGGRPLSALADPRRVAPAELRRLADGAGAALYTSSYLQRLEPMRILAWSVLRSLRPDDHADRDLETWLRRLGADHATAAA
ncbi:hypothetical protein [Streptomyces phaeochromogenes]|uniref:hypothetical protein n=1 Tax=Streptomyces phaeochromogenes TaxID=1923 RepID=UPI0038650191|nr:hypothetical protein OG277_41725 [Streptomyces phaeochromogenes]